MMLKGEDNVDFVNEEDLDWGWRYQRRLAVDGNSDENDFNDNETKKNTLKSFK